jgi:hypothetical protein
MSPLGEPTYISCWFCGEEIESGVSHDCPQPAIGAVENGTCPMCGQSVDDYLKHLREDCGVR